MSAITLFIILAVLSVVVMGLGAAYLSMSDSIIEDDSDDD